MVLKRNNYNSKNISDKSFNNDDEDSNNNNNNNNNDNNNNNNNALETRKYWGDVQWEIVSSHGERGPL